MVKDMIYLDNNATVAQDPEVITAVAEVMQYPMNASSIHAYGRRARDLVENARDKVKQLANAKDATVIFTASGTESNNMAVRGLEKYKVLVSAIEHPSILRIGVQDAIIPVTSSGIIDLTGLEKLLKQNMGSRGLVSVIYANNETGVIQPIVEIANIAHSYGWLVHTDAAQCFGKIDVDIKNLGVDMMTLSAHKFGGPIGAAALIVNKNLSIKPLIIGGGQEKGLRAGTENVAAIHGFGIASGEASKKVSSMRQITKLRDKIEKKIKSIAADAIIFCEDGPRLPNTTMIAMPEVGAETQLMHFDVAGIAVSAGSACSAGKVSLSHVLLAMGVKASTAKCAIRVSIGVQNTEQEIDKFIQSWEELYIRTRDKQAA